MNPQQNNDPDPRALAEHYMGQAALVRMELWRFDLNKRHLQVASVLLELSLGWGKESVRIDRLQLLSDLTGLAPSHVSATIDELVLMRILTERKLKGEDMVEYRLTPDSDVWRCKPRQTPEKLIETLHRVKMFNRPIVVLDDAVLADNS